MFPLVLCGWESHMKVAENEEAAKERKKHPLIAFIPAG